MDGRRLSACITICLAAALALPAAPAMAAVDAPAPLAGDSAAKRKKPKRCRRGEVSLVRSGTRLVVGKPTRRRPLVDCVKPGRRVRSELAFAAARRRLGLDPRFHPRQARAFLRRPLVKRVRRLEPALMRALVAAASSSARAARVTHTETTDTGPLGSRAPKGSKQFTRTTKIEPDPDERGGYTETETGFEGAPLKGEPGTGGMTMGTGTGWFLERCPDANGIVRGEFRERFIQRWSVDTPQGKAGMSVVQTTEADIVARVGDDARLQSYDYKGFSTLEARVAAGAREFPGTTRTAFWREGVDPRGGRDDSTRQKYVESLGNLRFRIDGPKGRIDGGDPLFDSVFIDLLMKTDWLEGAMRRALLRDEQGWYDDFECVEVEVAADRDKVERGGKAEIDAVAVMKSDRSRIQPVTYQANAVGAQLSGIVPMASATTPAHFTMSDIGQWQPAAEPLNHPGIQVIATSRRGRGQGGIQFPVKGLAVPLFDVEITLSGHQDCTNGNTAPLDSMTMTGSTTHRDSNDETLSAGVGTATGDVRTYPDNSDCSVEFHSHHDAAHVDFNGSYTDEGQLIVSWFPPDVARWAHIWIVPGAGTYTQDVDSGDRHLTWTMTVRNLRPLE